MFINFNHLKYLLIGVSLLIAGCDNDFIPKDVRRNIKLAGENGPELKAVIDHYKKLGEKAKLRAAYFLIENMNDKYGVYNEDMYRRYSLLEDIEALKQKYNLSRDSLNSILKFKQDSLNQRNGSLHIGTSDLRSDLHSITAEYLIKNIDLAFLVWKKPWAKHVNFEDFCEYILPYRIHNEKLSNWREYFYKKLIHFADSLSNPEDPKELTTVLSYYLYKRWNHLSNFSVTNVYPDPVSMFRFGGGQCDHRYLLFTAMCRSLGLPVGIDVTPQWTTAPRGHSWNFLVDTDGRKRPFNGAEDNMRFYKKNLIPMTNGSYVCTKVFRNTYANQKTTLPFYVTGSKQKTMPSFFQNDNLIDVTSQYDFSKTRCSMSINKKYRRKIIYLFTFSYGMELNPMAWAQPHNDSVNFDFIGVPAFYVPAIYDDKGNIKCIHNSLLLPLDKQFRQEYAPDLCKLGSGKIYRKYYASAAFMNFAREMVGGKLQGSNTKDFANATDLAVIKNPADAYHEVAITDKNKYRYLRYLPDKNNPIRIAEIEFWGINSKGKEIKLTGRPFGYLPSGYDARSFNFKNAFDGNIRTNFNAPKGSWIGIDLGKNNAATITKVWYLPRNNYNVIESNHEYELFYLTKDIEWKSLGKRINSEHYLEYDNIPCDALLLLRDWTTGREERIFLYDCEKQLQYWF